MDARSKDEITYATFGIDPAEFYATKFHFPGRLDPAAVGGAFRRTINFQKVDFLLEELRSAGAGTEPGLRVLDLGCGSGIYGAWVRHEFPRVSLHGLDMSEACVGTALGNGYDVVKAADFLAGLPYPDGYFDFVFTMDVFGHIEFRHKDRVIAEIARVTRPGGAGFHGIEAGEIDYFAADPLNPGDPIRKYVHVDGHVGVETLEDNAARLRRGGLELTAAFPWLVARGLVATNVIEHDQWGRDFSADAAVVDGVNSRVLADMFTGYYNRHHLERLFRGFGRVLTREELGRRLGPGPVLDYVLDLLSAGGGFAMFATRRPGDAPRAPADPAAEASTPVAALQDSTEPTVAATGPAVAAPTAGAPRQDAGKAPPDPQSARVLAPALAAALAAAARRRLVRWTRRARGLLGSRGRGA